MTNQINRRSFLKYIGLSTAVTLAGSAGTVLADERTEETIRQHQPDILVGIRERIAAQFEGREMGLDFRRINVNGEIDWQIEINADELYPAASSFKAFAVLWYFMETPRDEWVFDPRSNVYRVAIFSNNRLTGSLIADVASRVEGDGNMIEKFNDFMLYEMGVKAGIYNWGWPNSATLGFADARWYPTPDRYIQIGENTENISNVFTSRQIADLWAYIALAEQDPRWESDSHFQDAILATREILSVPATEYRSPIERVAYGGYTGKDGTLPAGDINSGRVINDAGIIRVPNGTGQYIISFMSTGEREETTEPALREVVDSIRIYEDHTNPFRVISVEGSSAPIVMDAFNYGFVRNNTTNLYLEPSVQGLKVDNPARRNSTYGTPYLMRSSLVRFVPVNDNWGRVIWDDPEDNAWTWEDWTFALEEANWNEYNLRSRPDLYVPIDELKIISHDSMAGIDFITEPQENTNKWLLMYVPRRELTLFEGTTPILKTPVVLNTLLTPRGRLYVNRVMMTRNMPTYPGVPYVSFLHDGQDLNEIGYALHGAPWHIWEQTVNEWETIRRFSAGCINIPNWVIPLGDYELPVDEFIFRWIGGFPDPAGSTSHFKSDIVHVMSATDPWAELPNYSRFDSMRDEGIWWGEILERWQAKPMDAPPRFFENPHNNNSRESVLNLAST
ncbi:MAG: L,D-transpeptidase [Chloroflexota bacterium]